MEREAHNSRTWGWEEDASSSYKITRRMTSFTYYHVKWGSFYSITLVDRSIKHNVLRSQDGLPMCKELVDPDCMGRVVLHFCAHQNRQNHACAIDRTLNLAA